MSMVGLTGSYRAKGTYVQVRSVWGKPDTFTASWLTARGKYEERTYSRTELEQTIRNEGWRSLK